MNVSKEEIENLRKQINRLKISLMFTQISTIMVTIILGYQCLRSIQNYHYLLQQVSMISTERSYITRRYTLIPELVHMRKR